MTTRHIGPATECYSPDLEWFFNCAAVDIGDSSRFNAAFDRYELFARRDMPDDVSMRRRPTKRDVVQKDKKGRIVAVGEHHDQRPMRRLYPAFSDPMTDERLEAVARARRIWEAWKRLPRATQDVLTLIYAYGVNVEEEHSRRAHHQYREESSAGAIKALRRRADGIR